MTTTQPPPPTQPRAAQHSEQRSAQHSARRSAKLIGLLFILPFFTYGGGNALINGVLSVPNHVATMGAHTLQYILGALLMLANSLNVVLLGVLLFPILAKRSKTSALAYFAARLAEGILLGAGVVCLLCILSLGGEHSKYEASAPTLTPLASVAYLQTFSVLAQKANYWLFQIAMITLSLGSIGLCRVLWRAALVPAPLAWMLFVGYVLLFGGAVMEFLGVRVGIVLSVPGGLCEIGFGAWLMVKGFADASTTDAG
jgi:hypothetical protein